MAIARSLAGAVVVKALGVSHKTEHNAVRLNLRGSTAVEAAATELLTLGDSLLVERFTEDVLVELIVGVHRDPSLGLLLTVGSGGVFVELVGDTATLLLPTTEAEVRDAVSSLRCAALLAAIVVANRQRWMRRHARFWLSPNSQRRIARPWRNWT